MSVLINLLPDTRLAKQREHHRRQLATGIAITGWLVCGGVIVLLLLSTATQNVQINSLTNNIKDKSNRLSQITGLNDALTIQAHLDSLQSLYQGRTSITNFLKAYVASDPNNVTLSSMALDNQYNLTVSGTGPSYAAIAKLEKAISDYNIVIGPNADAANTPYFDSVSVSGLSYTGNVVNFTLKAAVSPEALKYGN